MIRTLIWKEWREHRWKMLAIAAAFLLVAITGHLMLDNRRDLEILPQCFLGLACLVPGFVAIGTVMEERRTLDAWLSLPVTPRRAFIIKWCFGAATAVLPMLAVELLTSPIVFAPLPAWQVPPISLATLCLVSSILAANTYAWTAALAIRRTSELHAGLVAIGVLLGGGAITLLLQPDGGRSGAAAQWVWAAVGPLGIITVQDAAWGEAAWLLPAQAIVLLVLLLWSSLHYGRRPAPRTGEAAEPAVFSPLTALAWRWPVAWKTLREIGWMAWCYINGMCMFVVCMVMLRVVAAFERPAASNDVAHLEIVTRLGRISPDAGLAVFAISNLLLAVVLGTEIGLGDFERKVDRFWLSRPIAEREYFWKRFWLGWAVTMGCVIGPLLLVWGLSAVMLAPLTPAAETLAYTRESAAMFLKVVAPQISLAYGGAVLCATIFRWRVATMVIAAAVPVAQNALALLWFEGAMRELLRDVVASPWATLEFYAVEILLTFVLGMAARLLFAGSWKDRVASLLRGGGLLRLSPGGGR